MHFAEFADFGRQIPIGFQTVLEHLYVAGTIHRFKREHPFIGRRCGEHVFAEFLPVARSFPERAVEHVRRVHLIIIGPVIAAAHVIDEVLKQGPALFMPEHGTRTLILEMKQIHFPPEFAVIAFFSFLKPCQVGFQIFFVCPCRSVNTGQHGVVAIAAPIGSGHLHQLEGLPDLPRRHHMRSAAQIEPVTLIVNPDVFAFGNRVQQFHLVAFAQLGKYAGGFVPRPNLSGERRIALDDFLHLGFDLRQIVQCEWLIAGEIIEKAVFNDRPDCHLGAGIQFLHRFGHHMSCVMADQLQRPLIIPRDDLDPRTIMQRTSKICQRAIQHHGDGFFCQ